MNSGTPLVQLDVVIPVGPEARFLPEALASVRAQEGTAWHIWLIDDGGPAEPSDRLARFAAADLTVLPNLGRPGIGGARNTGAAAGSAPLLAFLDSDDRWPPGRTTALAALLGHANTNEEIAVGRMTQFYQSVTEDGEVHRALLVGALLMTRSAWQATGSFDEDLRLGEAIDWVSRARARGVWVSDLSDNPDVVLWRRLHGNNTTVQRRHERAAYLEVVRRHLRRNG